MCFFVTVDDDKKHAYLQQQYINPEIENLKLHYFLHIKRSPFQLNAKDLLAFYGPALRFFKSNNLLRFC